MTEFATTYPQNTTKNAGDTPVDEVQTISQDTGTSTAGTFKLTVTEPGALGGNSEQTTAIAYNASAATIQTALEALDNVPTGSIIASGGALPGTPVVLTFGDVFAEQDVPAITVDNTANTGGTYKVVETTKGKSGTYDVQIPAGNPNVDARASSGLIVSPHTSPSSPNTVKP